MGMIKFDVAHQLPEGEAQQRIEELTQYWAKKYGVELTWQGNRAKVQGRVMGVALDANLEVSADHVAGEASDPGLLLRSQARKYLEQKLHEYLDPKKSLADLKRDL